MEVDFFYQRQSTLRTKNYGESGQSTIEFLIGFSIMFVLIMLLLRVSFQLTSGYFLHYATFMASRTYMVVDVNDDEGINDGAAARRALEAFNRFNVGGLIPQLQGANPSFQSPDWGGKPLFSGVIAQYAEKFSPLKIVGGDSEVTYRSESFLRREPGREYCLQQICKAMEALGKSCDQKHITFYDNGC